MVPHEIVGNHQGGHTIRSGDFEKNAVSVLKRQRRQRRQKQLAFDLVCFFSFVVGFTLLGYFFRNLELRNALHTLEAREQRKNPIPLEPEIGPARNAYVSTQTCLVRKW